ncbi:response regulator [Candidatus Magnetominusculus xianensis]|uniref:Two-component system response regulator n=1 Tax=Candidatus Magnetominusculus xianensis TaxID=1748249 RepID=A0ABR5SD83_9BACT|nr:response regulator [Candidatus Magnetominusculus xianensis]KWT82809.1 two-component system response regulator [Candidatus Magnetominusculus xianensis]MBF0403497.1 response regulator [Nitrospirota bacterium]
MKILIADDDPNNRTVLQGMMAHYGDCDVVFNGKEAYEAFVMAHEEKQPYDLICLDIMMPIMDGNEALVKMRSFEEEVGIDMPSKEAKIVMTTALNQADDIVKAYHKGGCTAYLVKPVSKKAIAEMLTDIGILNQC